MLRNMTDALRLCRHWLGLYHPFQDGERLSASPLLTFSLGRTLGCPRCLSPLLYEFAS